MFAYTKIMQAMSSIGAGGLSVIQTFLATGTWSAPTGVNSVSYLVVGGGGVVVEAVLAEAWCWWRWCWC
jgi:hypothetical protein